MENLIIEMNFTQDLKEHIETGLKTRCTEPVKF